MKHHGMNHIRSEDVAKLIDGKGYQIVTIIHNETSTGLMNPVEEISKIIKQISPETILCVDTSFFNGRNKNRDGYDGAWIICSLHLKNVWRYLLG